MQDTLVLKISLFLPRGSIIYPREIRVLGLTYFMGLGFIKFNKRKQNKNIKEKRFTLLPDSQTQA
uniref:Uncharacterized protein n=1 Tax=Rhizophora mucronata TaxID=61149 RepID=A0A2P2LLS9_RHIMU